MRYKGWLAGVNTISLEELIANLDQDSSIGAITTFTGLVRDLSDHSELKVSRMEVEGWMEKGEEVMTKIAHKIGEKHNLIGVRIVHLTGDLQIGDPIVYVVLASIHRKEAFAALDEVIHLYKTESPVWKKEIYSDGSSNWISTTQS